MLTPGHQTAGNGLSAVNVAVVVVLIHAAHKVGEIVEDVVAGMSKDQAQRESKPGQEIE